MKALNIVIAYICTLGLLVGFFIHPALAAEPDDAVSSVIEQLTAIDTLQEMQNKKTEYTATGRYDITTTSESIIASHNAARSGYKTYIDTMFAARIAARQAYDALTAEQQALIDPALTAKLDNELPNVFFGGTFPVTPEDNEYIFEAVDGGFGYGYEISNHMVSSNIPQTFVIVDTSDGKTTWTPDGPYEYGKSNYDVTYCCDVETGLAYGSNYKRLNLEDSSYYNKEAAEHIRAIVMNAYPYVTVEEMKAHLKADGMDAAFVDTLTRADMISAVQQAIWTYANSTDEWNNVGYFASIDAPRNNGIYFTMLHDYSNELWDWFPGARIRTFDPEASYRINNLAHYLCSLDGISASDDEIVISDVSITRANLVAGTADTYEIGMYVHLSTGAGEDDSLSITVTSRSADDSVTQEIYRTVREASTYELIISAKYGDTITVSVEGTQNLGKGVYFYEPEGGRDSSQCLVGVAEGITKVTATESFVFNTDISKGIRIYKTAQGTGYPLSDITFDIYRVIPDAGETIGDVPTPEEVAKFAADEYKVGSITTDTTGYASLALENGLYLVVEQHNADKVVTPVDPFYIKVPTESSTGDGGEGSDMTIEYLDIVSIYPKNEPAVSPNEKPAVPPPPDDVSGSFSIVKHDAHDSSKKLGGASFQVFRTASADDADPQIVRCDGIEYAVVPVTVDGENLILTTDASGFAESPQLTCGAYFLVETEAPTGYDPLIDAIPVAVESDLISSPTVLYISNYPGSVLPETGGPGTRWLIAAGITAIAAAAVLLLMQKKPISRNL